MTAAGFFAAIISLISARRFLYNIFRHPDGAGGLRYP